MTQEAETLTQKLFEPLSTKSLFNFLIDDYLNEKKLILKLSQVMALDGMEQAVEHFKKGARERSYTRWDRMFKLEYGLASLNAKYWKKALESAQVLDFLPAAKRDEWMNQIYEMDTPEFTLDNLKSVISNLMGKRMDFLAEMVDGIFTGLSGEHLTNRPEGFGKRMIVDSVVDCFYGSYSAHKQGLIHDMRCVVSRFLGAKQPVYGSTLNIINFAKTHHGEWVNVDGNAFRLKIFKKGTGHIEVNPDISYRLNQILAFLHPMAIPAPHRKRPSKRKNKDFQLIENVLSPDVAEALWEGLKYSHCRPHHGEVQFCANFNQKHGKDMVGKVKNVLLSLGAAQKGAIFVFNFDPTPIIERVALNRAVPDVYQVAA